MENQNYARKSEIGSLLHSDAWQDLRTHQALLSETRIGDHFKNHKARATEFSAEGAGVFLDYSKNNVTFETLKLLENLCDQEAVSDWRSQMFRGELINMTEKRAVLHTALRGKSSDKILLDGQDVMPIIQAEKEKCIKFANAVRTGQLRGFSGQNLTTIVNIGIGGSDLGPRLAVRALEAYHQEGLDLHFVANVDGSDLSSVLAKCHPEKTLFLIASKTFLTAETLLNAEQAKKWLVDYYADKAAVAAHFAALSTNLDLVQKFGIRAENMFQFWDFVGGRYSVWSSIGLSLMIAIGPEQFEAFLKGAADMDQHFLTKGFRENLPMLMALIGIWHINFWDYRSLAVLPYDQRLEFLPNFLQQLDMESNGKSVDRSGDFIPYQTSPVVFGQPGTNGQHAFYQMLHQGTQIIPCDFLAAAHADHSFPQNHQILLANYIAQSEALMMGSARADDPKDAVQSYRFYPGNRPSNSLLYSKLSPAILGSLLALYEHKVFVQGIIWRLNSFDQWGVELGKSLALKYQNKVGLRADALAQSSKGYEEVSSYALLSKISIL